MGSPTSTPRRVSALAVRAGSVAGAVAVLLAAAAGCTDTSDGSPGSVPAMAADWRPAELPVPPGPGGPGSRLAVRDAVRCAGAWYVVGGVFVTDDRTRPAVWTSADGETWSSLPLAPRDYWAKRAVLYSVACRDGRLAMLGAKSGGAHGNPRVTSWYRRADGVFVDVIAGYTLYGGGEAINVSRIAAGGPDGWLIVGNRTSGTAVWTSPDATEFTRLDTDPELSHDIRYRTLGIGQVHDGRAWTVVGSASLGGRLARLPMVWTSPDGRVWQRQQVPSTDDFNDVQRVVADGDGLLALGLRGEEYGVWRRDAAGAWRLGEPFGTLDPERRAAPMVSGLARLASGRVLAAVGDGSAYQLWTGTDGQWRPVRLPASPPTSGSEQVLTVVGAGDDALLLADDGRDGRVWLSSWAD